MIYLVINEGGGCGNDGRGCSREGKRGGCSREVLTETSSIVVIVGEKDNFLWQVLPHTEGDVVRVGAMKFVGVPIY